MKLKKILNEIRLNELGDTNFHYDVVGKKEGDNTFIYIIDDARWQLNGEPLEEFEIYVNISPLDSESDKFKNFLKDSPYYKPVDINKNINDLKNDENWLFNQKYANTLIVSFSYEGEYESISTDTKLALNIMGTVTWCVMHSIKDFENRNSNKEVHFIQYESIQQIKTDRKTGNFVFDNGAKRDRLYKTFIKPRVTGYKFDTKRQHTLIQFDKIK
jgi:hypothetical protein